MSTPFYDLASLVVVPSGYKASKVYAQKPLTTDGQLAFTRSTTATRVNASGLIEEVASNVPRLDYLGSSCPRLLLEPQRTNIQIYSEQFDNAAWTKRSNIAVTSNAITAPDGTLSADKIAASDNASVDYGVFDFNTSGLYTYSVFAKKGELNYVFVGKDNTLTSDGVYFNLNTGEISSNPSSYSATITDYGDGWYRCSVYFATNVSYFFINPSVNGTSFVFSGQSGNGIYIWGAQAEVGAYPTSYVKTEAAAVTRLADACSKTGISTLIGQTQGTIFVEFNSSNVVGVDNVVFGLSTGSALNRIIIFFGLNVSAQVRTAGVVQGTIIGPASTANTNYKCALAYKANDLAFYVNGVLAGTDTSATIPANSGVRFDGGAGASNCDVPISQALVFKTRLSNSDLAALTA